MQTDAPFVVFRRELAARGLRPPFRVAPEGRVVDADGVAAADALPEEPDGGALRVTDAAALLALALNVCAGCERDRMRP